MQFAACVGRCYPGEMAKSIETCLGRILVLFPGSLGDFVCLLPALEELKTVSSAQPLTVAARGQSFEVAAAIPWISQVLSLDSSVFASLFSSSTLVSREAVQLFSSVGQLVSWFGHHSPEMRTALERLVPRRVRSFAFFRGQEPIHACEYYLRCLGAIGKRCPSLIVRPEDKYWCESYWQRRGWQAGARVLVMHPGSGGARKRWAIEGFVRIARWWRRENNRQVVILLGPAEACEKEIWQKEGIVENSLSLGQVGALVSRADFYVGNDSGVSHVAGAVGARGIVIFGPTSHEQWRPLGGALSVLLNREYRATVPDQAGISLQEVPAEVGITELARLGGIR